jgi:branched-chain amino acid transport system permease protein
MGIIGFYIRKFWMIVKNEVLVLPSRIFVVLFFLVLLLLPVFTQDPYLLRILILTSIFAILAASWDLLSGFTGQMNFGHALFFGVGAYTAALLNLHAHLPPWGSIPLGALGAVLAGLIIGIPCLRLKGTYLALTTLAFPIILMGILFAIPGVTGGELGISGLERLARSRVTNYYITVVLMLVLCTIMWKITESNTLPATSCWRFVSAAFLPESPVGSTPISCELPGLQPWRCRCHSRSLSGRYLAGS